tara:strand:- start:158 stop:448 length:291 start_codon:yes stop_codon:yes gene_type:complete
LIFEEAGLMTITRVRMTEDLKIANIFVSFLNEKKAPNTLITDLNSKVKFFKFHMGKMWKGKYMPDLAFYHDDSFSNAENITSLIKNIGEERGVDRS